MILPEGRHKSGMPYRWINLGDIALTPLPPDIAKMIMNRPRSARGTNGSDLGDTATILQGVPEGERDDTLFRWACRLRRQIGDGGRRVVELAVLEAQPIAARRSLLIKRSARLSRLGSKITAIEYPTLDD